MRLFYIGQACLVFLWWCGILVSESFYRAFDFKGLSYGAFIAFAVPDILVIVAGSVLAAKSDNKLHAAVVFGAWLYATLYCFTLSLSLGGGWPSSLIMAAATTANFFMIRSHAFQKS